MIQTIIIRTAYPDGILYSDEGPFTDPVITSINLQTEEQHSHPSIEQAIKDYNALGFTLTSYTGKYAALTKVIVESSKPSGYDLEPRM